MLSIMIMFILSELFFGSPFCTHRVRFAFPHGKTWLLVDVSLHDVSLSKQIIQQHLMTRLDKVKLSCNSSQLH